MFHEAHLIQSLKICLVQELDFDVLLVLGFLGVKDVARARPSLQ